ncbi:hypothetical protein, partial [Rhizobium sp. L74/93]
PTTAAEKASSRPVFEPSSQDRRKNRRYFRDLLDDGDPVRFPRVKSDKWKNRMQHRCVICLVDSRFQARIGAHSHSFNAETARSGSLFANIVTSGDILSREPGKKRRRSSDYHYD